MVFLFKRGADDSVESIGGFIKAQKNSNRSRCFYISGNYASCWIPATSQSWVEPAGFTKCQTSAKGCGKLLRSSLTVPDNEPAYNRLCESWQTT